MKNKKQQWKLVTILVLVLSTSSIVTFAQNPTDTFPKDPGSLSIYTIQNMSFGAFAQGGSGGTVIVSSNGTRSVTGSVIGLNLGVQYFHAIFELDAPVGSIISILNGPDVTLTGSNGGSMSLSLSASSPLSPFSTTIPSPGRTQVTFGGTLTVGTPQVTIPGSYSGTFYITFNQE